MQQIVRRTGVLCGLAMLYTGIAAAGIIPAGYVSWDVVFPGNAGQFDITNLTGANSAAPVFPITTEVDLSSLNLVVNFVGGSSETFGPASGYFTPAPDGESFNGSAIPIGGTNPLPISATLTGMFSTTSILDPGSDTILPTFSLTFSDTPSLVDGDFGVIYATETSGGVTPEPGTWTLLAMGTIGLLMGKVRLVSSDWRTTFRKGTSVMSKSLVPALILVIGQSAFGQVKLTSVTTPSSGVAGVTNVNLTASNVPSGTLTPADVAVSLASTCGGAAVTTTAANTVRTILGSTDRIQFLIPNGLTTGNYFVTIADSTTGDASFTTLAGSCSEVQVTGSSAVLNACVAGSSLGVLLPAKGATGNVTAYVPKGYWSGSTTGVFVTNIEGTPGAAASVSTAHVVNSCSSNPATGQTVCVANNTDVYVLSGTTLSATLTSASNRTTGFSGGSCNNCGVALNANNNTAVINMGFSGGASGSGVQILDLNTNTFKPAFPMNNEVSENISVDPTRSLILSASESGNYTLLQIQSDGSLKEFGSAASTGIENDSSAEDCSTGIGIAPGEFSNSVYLANLNSGAIAFGTTTYTAPHAVATLTTAYSFAAGLSGSAVAQGSGHLAVVTGEFGGNTFAVLKLPATPGTETPGLVDYAVAAIPSNAACGGTFSAGFDPHTVTAYTSPNTGDSYAVFAGYSGASPICLAVVDMTTVISATRGGSGYQAHDVAPANLPSSAVKFFPL